MSKRKEENGRRELREGNEVKGHISTGSERTERLKACLCMLLIFLILGSVAAIGFQVRNRFSSKTFISNVDCSGLTVEEAAEKIENANVEIRFSESKVYTISGKELGRSIANTKEIEKALSLQKEERTSNLKEFTLSENSYEVDSRMLKQYLEGLPEMQKSNMSPSQDAHLERKTDGILIQIIPEIYGNEIDASKALDIANEELKKGIYVLNLAPAVIQPSIKQEDPELVSKANEINNALQTTVTYLLSDGSTYVLDFGTIETWVKEDEAGKISINLDEHVKEVVEELERKVRELGAYATVRTKNGTYTLPVEYGFQNRLDAEAETARLLEELKKGGDYERMPCYSRYNDFSNLENYIEVWRSKQRVEMYRDGKNCFETPYVPVITGMKNRDDTPTGIFFSTFRASPYKMTKYSVVTVDTWVTVSGNVGFHDASGWRSDSEYTPDRYTYDGSHGCINMKKKDARVVYDNILLDETAPKGPYGFMPIIIHD